MKRETTPVFFKNNGPENSNFPDGRRREEA